MNPKLSAINQRQFYNQLLNWFIKNKRNLPWRNESHWYPVFLSEILLQQTQVEQALPYYTKFIQRFPDIYSLSKATEQEILSLWAGLGYYTRARNMLKAAKIITNEYDGTFPSDFKQALSLPGIGRYTASAILSIAFKKPHAVVDGNVLRVITRVFAVADDIKLNSTQKKIQEICDRLLPKRNPGNFNEGIMELGATICKKQKPDCSFCPIQSFCLAFKNKEQNLYPFKSALAPKRKVHHYVFIFEFKGTYLLAQRPVSGLLASMWEFPVIEVERLNLKISKLKSLVKEKYKISGQLVEKGILYRHQYSHIDLSYQPVLFNVKIKVIDYTENYVDNSWLSLESIEQLPVHNAHLKLIAWLKNLNR